MQVQKDAITHGAMLGRGGLCLGAKCKEPPPTCSHASGGAALQPWPQTDSEASQNIHTLPAEGNLAKDDRVGPIYRHLANETANEILLDFKSLDPNVGTLIS